MNPGLGEALSTPPPDSKIPPLGSFIVGLPFPFYKCHILPLPFYKCDILVMLNCWIPVPLCKWVPHHVEKEGCCSPEPPGAPAEKSKTKQNKQQTNQSFHPLRICPGLLHWHSWVSLFKLMRVLAASWTGNVATVHILSDLAILKRTWIEFSLWRIWPHVLKSPLLHTVTRQVKKKKIWTAEPFDCETSFPTALLF